MISDESDEDADFPDDDTLLAAYAGLDSPRPASDSPGVVVRDWPGPGVASCSVALDPATLAWFKANHADWQAEVRLVLRGWVAEQTRLSPATVPRA
jgi:hypothetical protein